MKTYQAFFLLLFCFFTTSAQTIYINQVAFDAGGPKTALIGNDQRLPGKPTFSLINVTTNKPVFNGPLGDAQQITEWAPGRYFYKSDFSSFKQPGKYKLSVKAGSKTYSSGAFQIRQDALATLTMPSILHYYRRQRANTPTELAADAKMKLYGSDQTIDMRGGWCDASGDVSKYFSHLAYANYMSPQQTPLVTWSMVYATEAVPNY
jgi:hypothetical protein